MDTVRERISQHMTFHLNGGSGFSTLVYDIRVDGQATGIIRRRTTNGRPRYEITEDVFIRGVETFDYMASRDVQAARDWIMARVVEKAG